MLSDTDLSGFTFEFFLTGDSVFSKENSLADFSFLERQGGMGVEIHCLGKEENSRWVRYFLLKNGCTRMV